MQKCPSFLGVNKTRAAQGDVLGRMILGRRAVRRSLAFVRFHVSMVGKGTRKRPQIVQSRGPLDEEGELHQHWRIQCIHHQLSGSGRASRVTWRHCLRNYSGK